MAKPGLVGRFLLREVGRHISSTKDKVVAVDNPFIPRFNSKSGRWHPPKVSLRRQKELIKDARKNGQLSLLPPGPKMKLQEIPPWIPPEVAPIIKYDKRSKRQRIRRGMLLALLKGHKRVNWVGEVKVREPAGSNVGNRLYAGKRKMFKGKKWQREFKRKQIYRKILMSHMAQRIRRFRLHRLRTRPNPLQPVIGAIGKSRYLPF